MLFEDGNCDNVCETCSNEQNLECWGGAEEDENHDAIDPIEDEEWEGLEHIDEDE